MSTTVSEISDAEKSKSSKSAKPFSSIPGPGGLYNIPYLGALLLFKPFSHYSVEQIDKVTTEIHVKYGPITRLHMGGEWVVMLEDLADVQDIVQLKDPTPYRSPVQPEAIYLMRENPTLQTLASTNGEEWRRLRSPLNARMNRPSSTTHYLRQQEAVAEDLALCLYRLQNATPEAMQQVFFKFGAESIGVVAFNKRIGFLSTDSEHENACPDTDKLLQYYEFIIRCIADTAFGKKFMYQFYRDSFYNKYKQARDYSFRRSSQFVEEAIRELQRQQREGTLSPDEPNFLLSLLSEKSLTMTDILMVCDGLITAGADSTGRSLQMLFYSLATNPDKQEKLAEEIMGELGHDGSLTQQALARMSYVKAAVNESMRLYFPLPSGTMRKLSFDITLSGYNVPKETTIQVSSNRIAKCPRYFDQPDQFLPERWLRGETGQREKAIHSLAFLPFGFGPRKCVGRRFAEQELYLAVVKVVQKYKIGILDNYGPMETTFTPFCSPARPVPLTFTPRQ